jgi:hypothetical protein
MVDSCVLTGHAWRLALLRFAVAREERIRGCADDQNDDVTKRHRFWRLVSPQPYVADVLLMRHGGQCVCLWTREWCGWDGHACASWPESDEDVASTGRFVQYAMRCGKTAMRCGETAMRRRHAACSGAAAAPGRSLADGGRAFRKAIT